MPSSQGPSFIPKQPARGNVQKRGVRKVYVLAYVSFVMFFGVLVASGGVFFYKITQTRELESTKAELVSLRTEFNQADFEEIKELDYRLNAAQQILDNHISIARILQALEDTTAESIGLHAMSVDRLAASTIDVEIEAETVGFNPVLFQKVVLDQHPVLAGSAVRDLTGATVVPDESRGAPETLDVTFMISKSFTTSDIRYEGMAPQPVTQTTVPVSNEVNTSTSQNSQSANDGLTDDLDDGFADDVDINQSFQ